MNKWREYLSGAGVVLGFFLLTSIAMASTGFQKASESVSPSPSPSVPPSEASETETVTDEPTSTVSPSDDGGDDNQEEPSATETVTDEDQDKSPNHGACVSYWAHQAKAQGLKGSDKGHFVSMIARDKSAVSNKVVSGGSPDATCDFQAELDAALPAISPTPTATEVVQSQDTTNWFKHFGDKRSGKKHGRSSKRRK